jgi:hypothetical protein
VASFKTKAELAFEEKAAYAMQQRDSALMREVGEQYDMYLKLIEPMCTYEDVWTDEVGFVPVCVVHKDNSRHHEDSGEHRKCLKLDPYPAATMVSSIQTNGA